LTDHSNDKEGCVLHVVYVQRAQGEENGKRKKEKKNVVIMREREMRNKIGEGVGLIKIDKYFHSPKLFS
jgi:hypothetical protein